MLPEPYLRFRHEFIALDPTRYPPEYIDQQVFAGFWKVWGTDKAALLTELKTYPSGVREIHALAAAGDMLEIVRTLAPLAEQFGRECGCVRAVVDSRPGWVRVLFKELPGYQVHTVSLRKDL